MLYNTEQTAMIYAETKIIGIKTEWQKNCTNKTNKNRQNRPLVCKIEFWVTFLL